MAAALFILIVSSSFLLTDPVLTLDVIGLVLADRGALTPEEASVRKPQPVREMRGFFAPRHF